MTNSDTIVVVCPNSQCKQKLRLSARKGTLRVTCPRCKTVFIHHNHEESVQGSQEYSAQNDICSKARNLNEQSMDENANNNQLVSNLLSSNRELRISALKKCGELSRSADQSGLSALEEAIRIKAEHRNISFYKPGVRGRQYDEYAKARDKILELARQKALLSDPEASGDLISAYGAKHGIDKLNELADEVNLVGGRDQFHAFQLLYSQMHSWVTITRLRTPEHVYEEWELAMRQMDTETKAIAILSYDDMAIFDKHGGSLEGLDVAARESLVNGDYDYAFQCFRVAILMSPNQHGGWLGCGMALYEKDASRLKQAGKAISLEELPSYKKIEDNNTWLAIEGEVPSHHNMEQAIYYFDKALGYDPDSHSAWYYKAACLATIGMLTKNLEKVKQGLDCLDHALRIKPGDHATEESIRRFRSGYAFLLASLGSSRASEAVCDICSKPIRFEDGYSLTTAEVVLTTDYWKAVFSNQYKSLLSNETNAEDALVQLILKQASQYTGWLVCEECSMLFVFDREKAKEYACKRMDPPNSGALMKALISSRGKCVFSDGDLEVSAGGPSGVPKLLTKIREHSSNIEPVDQASPLANLDSETHIYGYAAAMWTDNPANIPLLHKRLKEEQAIGYIGYIALREKIGGHMEFLQSIARQLSLTVGIVFVDGQVVPQTSKYGIR